MSGIKTFRLLKREQPDRAKIEKMFAKKNDDILLGALANPEHSEEARTILQELAEQRGLQTGEERGWAQTEESMFVSPFGRKPTFDQALAAPTRRRRVYRSLQILMLVCLVGAYFGIEQAGSTYKNWVLQGIDTAEFDPAMVARLRSQNPPVSYRAIYEYRQGLNLFAQSLRRFYIDILVAGEALDSAAVQQYLKSRGTAKEVIDKVDATFDTSDVFFIEAKSVAYEKAIDAIDKKASAGVFSDPVDHKYIEAFVKYMGDEVDYIDKLGGNNANAVAFDHFEQLSPIEPRGPRTPVSEHVGVALAFGGPALWIFGGIFSWLRPYRILLLRPFQSRKVSRSLKRFVQKNVSFNGHTFTLADKYVKESRIEFVLSWIPRGPQDIAVILLFFIPAIRQLQRWVNVRGPHSYRFLKKRLARRFTLNMFWQNSIKKILKVKSSDTWWKQCVDLLMYACHLIVVDLSWVKQGTEWELAKISLRHLERKTVFLATEETAAYAREVIAKFWPEGKAPPPLHVYRKSGRLEDRELYNRDVARIISESHLWDGAQEEKREPALAK